jgi:hypothetical protein
MDHLPADGGPSPGEAFPRVSRERLPILTLSSMATAVTRIVSLTTLTREQTPAGRAVS